MKLFYKIFLMIFICTVSLLTMGQNMIRPITISVPPNPKANTADWATAMPPVMIMAQTKMENGNIPYQVSEGTMLVTIKSGGNTVCGIYTPQTAPASNFTSTTKTWKGSEVLNLLGKDCILKPGVYELCVQFFTRNPATGAQAVTGEACKSFTIEDAKEQTYSPPQNIMPIHDKVFTEPESNMPVSFRWAPVIPRPKDPVTYRLKVWQLMEGQNAAAAIRANQPIIIKDIDNNTQLVEKIVFPPFSRSYVWNVEALSKDGQAGQEKSLGTSEATGFSNRGSIPVKYSPPVNQLPVDGKVFTKEEAAQPVNFRWTPVLPRPKEDMVYKVRVIEIKKGQSNAEALKGNKPIAELEVKNETQTFYKMPLRGGFGYVWNVEASKKSAIGDIEMLGTSEPTAFSATDIDCTCTTFDKFVSKPYVQLNGTTIDSIDCGGKLATKLQCNVKYEFAIQYQFMGSYPNNPCGNKDSVVIKDATGNIKASQQHVMPNSPLTYTFTQSGNYSVTFYLLKGGKICRECKMNLVVECPVTQDCCKNGNWYNKNWYNGRPLVLNGVGTIPVPLPASGTNLGTWPCAMPSYAFHCSFACANNCTAQINYSIYSSATGALISTQTVQSAAFASIPAITTNGNYLLVISAICGKDTCSNKLQYPFEIKCSQQVNCCTNSTWGTMLQYTNGGLSTEPLPPCGRNLGVLDCGSIKKIKVCYNCNADCKTTTPQIKYEIFKAGILQSTVSTASCSAANISIPNVSGSYSLVISAICGDSICNTCTYYFETSCTSGCDCKSVQCTKKLWYEEAGKGKPIEFACNAQTPLVLDCNINYHFFSDIKCNPNTNCEMTAIGEFRNSQGQLVIQQTPFSGSTFFNIISWTPGIYSFIIKYYVNGVECSQCTIPIRVVCNPSADCCKNSSWGELMHYTNGGITGGPVPRTLPASGGNLGTVACGSTKQFKICYNCAKGCGAAQIKYDVYKAYSLVLISSTTVASCSIANIIMPSVQGNYQVRIAAICNDKECNAMDYFINTECAAVDCCKGGKWTNKSLDWDVRIINQGGGITELPNEPAQKAAAPKQQDKKSAAGKSKTRVDLNTGPSNPLSGSLKVNNCSDTIKTNEGNEFTLNAAYSCNTAQANCSGKVIAKVKDPNGITYGTWPLPHLFKFAASGVYTVTYYAYCGETVCDSCTFYVHAAKDCCKGSRWIKAEYQITNKKPNGDWDKSDQTYYALPLIITSPIPVLKADVAIDLERLQFSCAQGCTSGFILKRKNLTTGVEETPEIISATGTPSVYAKPYPQLITIIPTCGGISCGNPIIFRLECLHKDCLPPCVSDTIVFSTGITATGTIASGTEPQWFSTIPLEILSPGIAPFFGASGNGGSATILQSQVDVSNITSYTASRNFSVSKNCTINFSGKLGISRWTDTTWAALFKSFKLHKGSAAGPVVWSHISGTPGSVGTYETNDFYGSVAVTPGVYTFVFEYNKAGADWNRNAMFVTGIIVGNILPTSKDCCPATNTGSTGHGNPTGSYGQAGQLNGLGFEIDTCGCNEGMWISGFETNGAGASWNMLNYSPPLTFTNIPSSYPLKLGLFYICDGNSNCTFKVKLIKKNLTTNVETVIVSENDIIPYSSYYNHRVLSNWLYAEEDICQYTIIPYCNGKECDGNRLVFNINKKNASGAKQVAIFSATCKLCGKKFALDDLKEHQRICKQIIPVVVSGAEKTTGGGYQCDCCSGVYTAEQLIKHGKACCKKKEDLNAVGIKKSPKLMCKCCGKDFTDRHHDPECCLKKTGEPGVIINKGILTSYYCKCCDKNIPFTGASAAANHQKECCAKPVTTSIVTAGKTMSSGLDSYVCSICNEPISGGASGLARHESEAHNMFAITNAYKGWDGKVQGKQAGAFPYYCKCCNKTIEFTGGETAASHQKECCNTKSSTTTTGKMVNSGSYVCTICNEPISGGASGLSKHEREAHDLFSMNYGMLNGRKELMSNEETDAKIGRHHFKFGSEYQFKGSYIKFIDAVPIIMSIYYDDYNKIIQTIMIPLIDEKGYLKMQGVSTLITQVGDKKTVSIGPTISSKYQDYVGHVTLLK